MYQTPKRHKASHNSEDSGVELTPDPRVLQPRSCNVDEEGPPLPTRSPANGVSRGGEKCSPGETRRGRPRATLLSALILEGSTSPSNIKCKYCGRVFPREKSLQAHLRTHTGEKPYACDYPRCSRRFAQSGQLKTHQRLHTGEKPFVCTASSCARRFTHANRHCPDHPDVPLKRLSPEAQNPNKKFDDDHNAEVREWLINWDKRQKAGEGPNVTPKKSIFRREESVYSNGSYDLKSSPKSELDDSDMSLYNSSSDNMEFDPQPDSTSSVTPRSELPKKRWLREAVRNQNLWDSTQDLAFPINWNEEGEERTATPLTATEENVAVVANENQNRPSVLVCVQGGKSKEISSDEIQGAMALVELKNSVATDYKYRV